MPQSSKPPKPLRIEPLRLRVDRNRLRFVVFLVAFVTGSAVLLSLAFVAVPVSLIGLVVDSSDHYPKIGIAVAAAVGILLVLGGPAACARCWGSRGRRRRSRLMTLTRKRDCAEDPGPGCGELQDLRRVRKKATIASSGLNLSRLMLSASSCDDGSESPQDEPHSASLEELDIDPQEHRLCT